MSCLSRLSHCLRSPLSRPQIFTSSAYTSISGQKFAIPHAFAFSDLSRPTALDKTSMYSTVNSPIMRKYPFKVALFRHIGHENRAAGAHLQQSQMSMHAYANKSGSAGAPLKTVDLPPLSTPAVFNWLFFTASLVFGIVIVGGITRLTESGLSIVDWRPITGILPPLSELEWLEEFQKYQLSPEFKTMNLHMNLADFKEIFFWEYAHRALGRVIGLSFVLPLTYFALRRKPRVLTAGSTPILGALALLIGAQGVLGWYMVKSGLDEKLLTTPGAVVRVSQYRLAAHLGMALLLYAGILTCALHARMDWLWSQKGIWSGLTRSKGVEPWAGVFHNRATRRFKIASTGLAALVLLTALSGAFVAGLDAGLVYNEFPTMAGGFSPPWEELMSPRYAQKADGSDLWWRNMLENPSTVQFDHRMLGITTYTATTALFLRSLFIPSLPLLSKRLVTITFAMVNVQAALGISTLLYLVPVPLAAAHQAGSVALLTAVLVLVASMKRPSSAAMVWRQAKITPQSQSTKPN